MEEQPISALNGRNYNSGWKELFSCYKKNELDTNFPMSEVPKTTISLEDEILIIKAKQDHDPCELPDEGFQFYRR